MEAWLSCTLSPGLFSHEFGVDGEQFDGKPFSLFVPANTVKYEQEPKKGGSPGWVRVGIMQKEGPIVLVRLPRQTFQNGPFVTVKAEQLETITPARVVRK